MSLISYLRSLYRNLVHRGHADADLDAELGAYIAEQSERKRTAGLGTASAARATAIESGGVEQLRHTVRSARVGAAIELLVQDAGYAARRLRQSPSTTFACILAFAIGIGANAAVFSLANGLLFRPLPVNDPASLVYLTEHNANSGWSNGISRPDRDAIRDGASDVFSGLATAALDEVGLRSGVATHSLWACYISDNFFDVMGVEVPGWRGRTAGPEMVLSFDFWQSRFHGDRGVVGGTAFVDGKAVTIVGIAPRGFHGVSSLFDTQGYVSESLEPPTQFGTDTLSAFVLARLRPGVGLSQAQVGLALIAGRLAHAPGKPRQGFLLRATEDKGMLNSSGTNPVGAAAAIFLGLSGLVLLLAAANIVNLLLARAAARQREMSVRAALGGAGWRLARQAALETAWLALGGGLAGVVLGSALSRGVTKLPANMGFPISVDFSFDWRVYAAAMLAMLVMALAAGIIPALRAARCDPADALRGESGASASPRRLRLRGTLVTLQVAGSLALVIVGGLFARSLIAAQHAPIGFDPHGLVYVTLDASAAGYDAARGDQFFNAALDRVRHLPGVTSASLAEIVPFGTVSVGTSVKAAGKTDGAAYNTVTPDYLATMHIPLLAGRFLNANDHGGIAVIDRAMATKFWPAGDALGKTFTSDRDKTTSLQVVGVVGSIRTDLGQPIQPTFYTPFRADKYVPVRTLQVRGNRVPNLTATVVANLHALDAAVPLDDVQTGEESLDGLNGLYIFRFGARLASWLGALGFLLAIVGVYGVVAYSVAQRTREIGVRVALGARPRQVIGGVMRGSVWILATGMTLGLALAVGIAMTAASLLIGISPLDPPTFLGASLAMAAVGLLASFLPARRAASADPLASLRAD